MEEECGFDCLGWDEEIGFDYMSLLKGAGGMMSGAGGLFGGGSGGGGGGDSAAVAAEKARLQAIQAQAEASARTWKIVGGIAIAVLGLGGIALLMRPKVA